jgi:hypothetical protein
VDGLFLGFLRSYYITGNDYRNIENKKNKKRNGFDGNFTETLRRFQISSSTHSCFTAI